MPAERVRIFATADPHTMNRCKTCGALLTPFRAPGKQGLAAPFDHCLYWKVLVYDKRTPEWIQLMASSKKSAMYNAFHNFKYYPWVSVHDARPISQRTFKIGKFHSAPRSVRRAQKIRELEKFIIKRKPFDPPRTRRR